MYASNLKTALVKDYIAHTVKRPKEKPNYDKDTLGWEAFDDNDDDEDNNNNNNDNKAQLPPASKPIKEKGKATLKSFKL